MATDKFSELMTLEAAIEAMYDYLSCLEEGSDEYFEQLKLVSETRGKIRELRQLTRLMDRGISCEVAERLEQEYYGDGTYALHDPITGLWYNEGGQQLRSPEEWRDSAEREYENQ